MPTGNLLPHGVDASGFVQQELPCRSCGYLLKGLVATGRCPECGAAVEVSLHGDSLVHASPLWLARVGSGFRRAQVASTLLLLLFPGTCCLSAIEPAGIPLVGACTVIVLLWTVGVWNATTPEPGKPASRLRSVAAVLCGCSAMAQIAILAMALTSTLTEERLLLYLGIEWALMAACWSLHMRIAADLKKRLRHADRIGPVRLSALLAGVALGTAMLILAAVLLAMHGIGPGPDVAAVLIPGLLGYTSLIGSAFVFGNAANLLRSYAIVSRANWHASSLQARGISAARPPGAAPALDDSPDPPPGFTP